MAASQLNEKQRIERINELRLRVMLGKLPDDFLRLPAQGMQMPGMAAPMASLDPAAQFYAFMPPNTRGRLVLKIVEARLAKNYGLMRMDPYARIRIGNAVFETHTSVNGGKTPVWSRVVNAYLPIGVESIYLQVMDERSFTQDECVAWANVVLPNSIFAGETVDEWYPLSGPLGDGREGVVNLVMSFTPAGEPAPRQSSQPLSNVNEPVMSPPQQQVPPPELFTEAELNELCEMFPNIEKEVIKTVLEAKRGDKDGTVSALIEMSQ